MIRRQIGRTGRDVNAIGLGCMGMSIAYGEPMNEADAVKLLGDLAAAPNFTMELVRKGQPQTLIYEVK